MNKLTLLLTTVASLMFLASAANAKEVEIMLSDKLDGVTSEYCIDVKGGNKNVDITKGLQAHTCYSYRGSLSVDQIFDTERFADNILYMSKLNVCATVSSLEVGATVGLAECDGSDLQALVFSEKGTISPKAAPELCMTAADETRFGRSKKHQIKGLSLETCSEDKASVQTWEAREIAS